ncbi:MAG: transcription antitermination factor NusB [Desulfovibrionaceae bacterium]|nr:transcription antitermination factor NusB [Desulfovibrionaceae bacterium]
MMPQKTPPRRVSRGLAFQTLYGQEFVSSPDSADLRRAFMAVPRQTDVQDEGAPTGEADAFAWELVEGVWQRRAELDDIIARFAHNWRLERVGRVELAVLRLAVYEMLYRPDVPAKAALNEALELERQYGEEKSRIFVNGVLDAVVKALDKGELRPVTC